MADDLASVPEREGGSAELVPPRPAVERYDDTVSLRELYLVFRSGLPLVVVVAVACGVLAFAYRALQGQTYTAEAVVQVVRPRVSAQPSAGLDVGIASVLDPDAYAVIAEDRATIERVMADLEVGDPSGLGTLTVRAGPGPRSAEAFAVTHAVTVGADAGPETAAAVANAWAEATLETVRSLLTAPFTAAGALLSEDVAAREAAYQAASLAWAEFLAKDEREELRRRLEALVDLDAARQERLGQLEAEAAGVRARAAAAPAGSQARAQLEADLAALEAEAEHIRGDLAASGRQGEALRARLSALEAEATELQRAVSAASLAYFRASPAEASLELQEALAAGAASVVLPATPPFDPDPRNRAVTVAAAVLVGGLAATLFVFLRAAVREPEPG